MSHDDIRAALVRDQQRGGRFPADPELQHKAADWLAELLAEVDALTTRAKAAEQVVRRVRGLAEAWATQPNDYDEDTEQPQIEDGRAILRALDGGER